MEGWRDRGRGKALHKFSLFHRQPWVDGLFMGGERGSGAGSCGMLVRKEGKKEVDRWTKRRED